jgi:TatD DNase family protein
MDGFETGVNVIVLAAEKYGEGVYASVGLHPVHLHSQHLDEEESSFQTREENFDYEYYKELTRSPKTIAIGECGLDLYRLPEGISKESVLEKQIKVFKEHVRLSYETGLPLAIHVRDAYQEMIDVLKEELALRGEDTVRGVIHCYIGNWYFAEALLKLGLYLGFTGIITFPPKKSDPAAQEALLEVVRRCPLERMVLETDSPYLAPIPYRGKRAEPWMVEEVAKKIAELKGISIGEVRSATTANASKLFTIPI